MSLSDYVHNARASLGDDAGVRPLAGSDAEALLGIAPEDASGDGRSVVVAHAPRGEEVESLHRLAESIGDRGVGVLALVVDPASLPVGPLVSAAMADGLRVVRAEGVHHRRARTVLTVTRDAQVPVAAYLADNDVASGAAAAARVVNEWLVEGLALRAQADELTARLRGSEDEVALLRIRVDELATAAKAERAALRAELEEARRAVQVESERAARGPSVAPRRAVPLLQRDPVAGFGRLARGAARRLRR